jgi:hypothetical protein
VKGIWNQVRRAVRKTQKSPLTSRMTVVPKPRYKPKIPSRVRIVLRANMDDFASSPYADVCVRVLTTSVGTRIKHAAYDLAVNCNAKKFRLGEFSIQFLQGKRISCASRVRGSRREVDSSLTIHMSKKTLRL